VIPRTAALLCAFAVVMASTARAQESAPPATEPAPPTEGSEHEGVPAPPDDPFAEPEAPVEVDASVTVEPDTAIVGRPEPATAPAVVVSSGGGVDSGIVVGVLIGVILAAGLGIVIGVAASEFEGIGPPMPGTLGVVTALEARF
jgi:hypothetical protein